MPGSNVRTDAMSDVLSLMRMQAQVVCSATLATPWSLSFSAPVAHFHLVEEGSALLRTGNVQAKLEAGDLAILPHGRGHILSTGQEMVPTPIDEALKKGSKDEAGVWHLGDGAESARIVCGRFSFDGVLAASLLSILPPVLHLEYRTHQTLEWLRLSTQFLIGEIRNPRPGSAIMITRLLELIMIQALREWGAQNPSSLGWIGGMRDNSVGVALNAIHQSPDHAWTVEELAKVAGLSRSAFAVRFTEIVGQPPLKYLAVWRLDIAADALRGGNSKLSEVARSVGYGSDAAFSRAFRGRFGISPGSFRKGASPAQS